MRHITLDGRALGERESAHRYLARALALPPYYGENLDALADCLSELDGQTRIVLLHADELTDYGRRVRAVFEETAEDPQAFSFEARA